MANSIEHRVVERTKQAAVRFDNMVGNPAKADEALGDAYRALIDFKLGLDAMEEIPGFLLPYYKQVMLTIGKVIPAQQEAYQLRMMMTKLPHR